MDKYEELEQELFDSDIALSEYPLESINAFCLKYNNKDHICINKNKNFSNSDKYWIVEHEYSHIRTNSFYTVENSRLSIKRRELKANDDMVTRLNLVASVINKLKQGLEKWEVADELNIPEGIIDYCLSYAKRKKIRVIDDMDEKRRLS